MSVKVGLHILDVKEEGVASKAGLQIGDVLIKYNNRVISGHGDLVVASAEASKEINCDKPVTLTIVRNGKELLVETTSGKLGASLKEGSYHLEGDSTSAPKNEFLIGVLDTVAWIALILGIIGSFIVFGSFAGTQFGLIGVISAIGVFIQSFIVFALLKVISTMASEVKSIKAKLDQ